MMQNETSESTQGLDAMPLRQRWSFFALFLAAAVLLSAVVLVRTPGQIIDRLVLDRWTAIAPFGRVEVVFVHVVAGLAIAMAAARGITSWIGRSRDVMIFSGLMGGVVAVLTLYLGPVDGKGGVSPFWLRVGWMFALQLPWCCAAFAVWPRRDGVSRTAVGWMVLLAPAILLPMAHAKYAAKRESQSVGHFASTRQYMKAWSHVVALESMAGGQATIGATPPNDFMSTRVENGRPSDLVRSNLVTNILAQTAAVGEAVPPGIGVADAIQRAQTLLSLDRLEEATELLENVSERRPDGLLLLAAIYEERRDANKAVEILEEAASRIGDATGETVEAATREIYQRLAQNLRLQQRFSDAEACLLRAIENYDHSHGFFYNELGMHCQQGGRFQKALEYYRKCVEADSRYSDRVEKAVRELRYDTPGCIMRPVTMVTR